MRWPNLMVCCACTLVACTYAHEAHDIGHDAAVPAAPVNPLDDADSGELAAPTSAGAADSGSGVSVIAAENALPGSSAWQLEQPARAHEVEGYASLTSARAGDQLQLFVNVDKPRQVRYELYRMGYYQGLGGRMVASAPARSVQPQPSCPADPQTGLIECRWEPAFALEIDPTWVTGQYFFKLITAEGIASYVPLVVREATPHATVLVQSAVATWQAYNVYGGSSLYRNGLPAELGFKPAHAYAVSFDRPYTCQDLKAPDCQPGAGDFEIGERWLFSWLEQRGVDVGYVTSVDLDREDSEPGLLAGRDAIIVVGHDEYWSVGTRSVMERARDNGLSLVFLSANTGYWRVRYASSGSGQARRRIICYKERKPDPEQGPTTTVLFRDEPVPRPEQALLGIMYDDKGSRTYFDGFAPVVTQPQHWIFEGTHVSAGDALGHVVGYEWDRFYSNKVAPAGQEIVAHANLFNVNGQSFSHDISVYYPSDHSLVFAAGSLYWARGLSHPHYRDAVVTRITQNVLRRAKVPAIDPTPVSPPTAATSPRDVQVLAGSGEQGSADGPALQASFGAPVGLALAPDGTLYVVDNAMHAVRRIAKDGSVSTLAGCGHAGADDGVGTSACFRYPTGIVLAPDGSLIIADTENHKLRRVATDGAVSTIAGTGKNGEVDAKDPLRARLSRPRGLALAPDGTLYFAESGGNNLRKLDADGVTTMVGAGQPTGLALAPDGALYLIATRAGVIQRYTPAQGLSTLAGVDGQYGDVDGEALQGHIRAADGLAYDLGHIVFTDSANHKLKVVDEASGRLTTLAGDGSARVLQMPRGVLVTADAYIVADTGNHRIVRVAKP